MPLVLWKILQCGPTSKIMISLSKVGDDKSDTETEIINVRDMVEVMFKFQHRSSETFIPSIRMKKNAGVLSDFTIKISTESFNKQVLCSDEWLETGMGPKKYDRSKNIQAHNYATWFYACFIEVNITVQLQSSIAMLPNYNLYEDTEFTDFELHGTDGKVAVHKTILLGQSDVFKSIMRGEWKEKAEAHMKIEGVTVQTLQHLKEYMYLGTLPDEGLDLLLVVAARYLMDRLTSLCVLKLVESMKPEDFDGLVKLACQHNIPGLVRALVLQIPDKIVIGIHQLKINDQEAMKNGEQ